MSEEERLRSKKKQIHEDLNDKVKEVFVALDSMREKAEKKRNQRKYKW